MKRILLMITIITSCFLLACSDTPDVEYKILMDESEVSTYFDVRTRVTNSGYGFIVYANLSPKTNIKVMTGCYCTVWVRAYYTYLVGGYSLGQEFYIGCDVNIDEKGYGRGMKNEYRGVYITNVYLKNWYDIKNITIVLEDS